MQYRKLLSAGVFFALLATTVQAQSTAETASKERRWHDASGKYSVRAAFVNADDELVVLESENDLLVVRWKELSAADQEFVESQVADDNKPTKTSGGKPSENKTPTSKPEKAAQESKQAKYDSTWTLRDGEVIRGSLIAFGEQNFVVNRDRGKLYVDGKQLAALPPAYGKIVPDIVAKHDKVEISDSKALEDHLAERGGGPLTYRAEGIQVLLESGDTTTIPVSLLSKHEMEDVLPGFRRWKAAQDEDIDDKERSANSKVERLLLEAHSKSPARRLLRQQRKLQFLQLSLLASDVGATNLWQVALHSGRPYTFPHVVLVPAQNSLIAQRLALAKYPGWKAVAARQLDR